MVCSMKVSSFLVLCLVAVSYAAECEDIADFCSDVKDDCNNPEFSKFYRDQCRKTCGFCGQRFLDEEICKPFTKTENAETTCNTDEIGEGTSCKVTCHSGYKLKVINPADEEVLDSVDDVSYTRLCWCEMGRCNWFGGVEFAFCEKKKANECDSLPTLDNSQVRCSNGFMHTSSCFTVCDAGHKFTSIYASNKGRRYPAQLRNICFCRNSQCKWYGNTGLQCTAEDVEKPEWGEWSEWSTCSATCGRGQRFQVRACSEEGKCAGAATKTESCQIKPCECPCAGASNSRCRDRTQNCKFQRWRCSNEYVAKICMQTCGRCPKKATCPCA